VAQALSEPLESIKGRGDSIIAIGRARSGRYIKIIYSPDELSDGIFVITAMDVPPRQIRALKKAPEAEAIMKQKDSKRSSKRRSQAPRDPNRYPRGLNRKKVQAIVDYYENQTDEEAIAEAEAAYRNPHTAMMQIPIRLVPQVRKLLAKRAG